MRERLALGVCGLSRIPFCITPWISYDFKGVHTILKGKNSVHAIHLQHE